MSNVVLTPNLGSAVAEKREIMAKPVVDNTLAFLEGKIKGQVFILRPQYAIGKAYGVLAMGFGGRELARRAPKNPHFFNALSDLSGGRLVPVPGGVLIRSQSGEIIGSVGISGDVSENDEICAVAGIKAAELVPDTGDAS